MANNKKQTAVEWQFEQLFNSFEKFNNGEYTFDEFLSSNLRIREQAKEMEKEQMINFAVDFTYGTKRVGAGLKKYFIELYNETYGGNNLCG
jgi:hypothetical protein